MPTALRRVLCVPVVVAAAAVIAVFVVFVFNAVAAAYQLVCLFVISVPFVVVVDRNDPSQQQGKKPSEDEPACACSMS